MNTIFPRMLRSLAAGLLAVAALPASAADVVEGVQYKPLRPAQPTSVAPGKVEVVEVPLATPAASATCAMLTAW